MKQPSKTVVFFGSGPIAAQSLELLLKHTPIEAVITKPQPRRNTPAPVLAIAKQHNLPVRTPHNKQSLSTLFKQTSFSSKIGLVIDYGIIISKDVIDSFPLRIANSHFSLLPQWRGPDPLSFTILSGQSETGVSLMLIDEKMDEGPLLAQAPYTVPDHVYRPALAADLITISDSLIEHILPAYVEGSIDPMPQEIATIASSAVPSYAHIIKKSDGGIDWSKPAERIEREIRAFIEWPKSYTKIADINVVITAAEIVDQSGEPGEITTPGKNELIIYCSKKALKIIRLKPAGKREMPASAFLAGYNVPASNN